MDARPKRLPAVFFRTETGAEPVREWLKGLSRKDRLTIGEDIKAMGMPLCRSLGEGLWEVRTRLDDRVVRVFFCVSGELMVLLHGFIKKSRRTPKDDLDLARRRKRELEKP